MKQFALYQVKKEYTRNFGFNDYVSNRKLNGAFGNSIYQLAYEGNVTDNITIDDLYRKFNIDRPEDFIGRSMSISDVILFDGEYFYCDDFGWKNLVSFTEDLVE